MTFALRRNRLTMHFSERILVVKRRMSVRTSWMRNRYSYTISSITHSMERFPYWESAGSSASHIHRIVWNVTIHSTQLWISWAKWSQATPTDHTCLWFILILSSHLLIGLPFCFKFSHQKLACIAFFTTRATFTSVSFFKIWSNE